MHYAGKYHPFITIDSSMFLMGPKKQFEIMFDEKRRITTIVLLTSIALTLLVAFVLKGAFRTILLFALVFVTSGALFWYIILCIPMAKKIVCGCFGGCFGKKGE